MKTLSLYLFCLFAVISFSSCDTGGDPLGDALLEAAAQGKIDQMKVCVDNGVDINYTNPNFLSTQQTACMKAALNGQLEALKWLVDQKADWHKATSGGENPITLAAQKGHFNLVYYLLEIGEDVNYRESNYGKTALLSAAELGNVDAVRTLLLKGADMNVRDKEKRGVLNLAARNHNSAVLVLFFQKGLTASEQLLFDAVDFSPKYKNFDKTVPTLDLLLGKGLNINAKNDIGDTPLNIASMHANDALMAYLNRKGADASIKNNNGMNAQDLYDYYNKQQQNQ